MEDVAFKENLFGFHNKYFLLDGALKHNCDLEAKITSQTKVVADLNSVVSEKEV